MANFKNILKGIAPTLATALGGPLAGVAAKFITDKLGGGDGAQASNIESILRDLTGSSEKLGQLKKIEADFKLEMQKLDVDVFSLEVQDRSSARELAKENMWPQIGISFLFLVTYFALLFYMFSIEVSDEMNMRKGENSLLGELQILIGVLTAGVSQILGFWFGGLFHGKRANVEASYSSKSD